MIDRYFVNDAAPYIDAEFLNSLVAEVNSLVTNAIKSTQVSAASTESNYVITVDGYGNYDDYQTAFPDAGNLVLMTLIANVSNSANCTIAWGDGTYALYDISTGMPIGNGQIKVGAPSLLTFDGDKFWYVGDSNCSPISKRVTVDTATATIEIEDNTEYRFSESVTSLSFTFPGTSFESWMMFTTGDSISVTFPTYTKYANKAPVFKANTTYEISVKDSVVVVAEVVF